MAQTNLIDVIPEIAQICRKAPNATMIRALNRAAREFCKQTRWLRQTLQGETVADQEQYSMGSDPDLEIIGIKAMSAARQTGNTKPWPLWVSAPTGWPAGQNPAAPRFYAYTPESMFALNPTPDAIYDLVVTLVVQPSASATSIPSQLLVRWDRAIKAGALSYLMEIPGQEWTDKAQAQMKLREFQASVNNARADEQREYQAGTVIARRRPFIAGSM